ncbi:Glycine receptor subunit alpha-3 [Tyrophagus putrescentiae]|nr:Glycine receptor subunit alpha-3 [Tyrophagus putrescentiae]
MSSRHRCYFFLPNFRFLGRYLLLLLFLVPERGTFFFLQQSSKSSLSSSSSFGAVEGSCISSQDDIEYFFALKTNASYWKWIKPNGQATTNVTVSAQLNRVAFYNDVDSTFDIQLLLELQWLDDRLTFLGSECNKTSKVSLSLAEDGSTVEEVIELVEDFTIEGNEWHFSKIWSPKLRIARNKDAKGLDASVMFLRINSTGHVRVRMRSNVHLFCPMDYRKYPFDSQSCIIKIVSNDLSAEKLMLRWTEDERAQLTIDDNMYISSHSLEFYSMSSGTSRVKGECFSDLSIELHFKRQWGHYMLTVFFPSMLIVATSWLSFWVEITSPPARITLCVTTLLALVTVSKDVQADLPKVPYIKATDLWFAGCAVSIFLSLIEYIIVAYTFRAESKKYKERKKMKRSLSSISLSSMDTTAAAAASFAKLDSSAFLSPMEYDRFSSRRSSNISLLQHSHSHPQNSHHHHHQHHYQQHQSHHHQSNSNSHHHPQPLGGLQQQRNSLPTSTPSALPPPPRIHFTFSPPESPSAVTGGITDSPLNQLSPPESPPFPYTLKDTPQEVAESIDRKSRIIFPFMFVLFNLIYWSYYN